MFYDTSLYNLKNKKAGFLCGHTIVQVCVSLTIVVSHIGLKLLGMAPYLHWTNVGPFKRSDTSLFKANKRQDAQLDGARASEYHVCGNTDIFFNYVQCNTTNKTLDVLCCQQC
jgi:hypothetical protein